MTALERKGKRLDPTRENLAANETSADVDLVEAEAPEGLPDDDPVAVRAVLEPVGDRFERVTSVGRTLPE